MPAVMEKTFTVDRALAQRAEGKLHLPHKVRRVPGGLKGKLRIAPDFDQTSDELIEAFDHSSRSI